MKKNNGFTIIEIITVLLIITLIVTMVIAGISGVKQRINNKAYNSKVKLIEKSAKLYAKDYSEKLKEDFGECTSTGGYCDCTEGECVYRFNTTVQELIEIGYYEAESNSDCSVTNPKDIDSCLDDEPIEIILSTENSELDAHFGIEVNPYDISSSNLCELKIVGTLGNNGWYIGDNNKLVLIFKINEEKVSKYGLSQSPTKTYNNINEQPLSSTTGVTYYGYIEDIDGNEGKCIMRNIKVDATNPTDPNMLIDSDFNVVFNGSKDTYSERVKYSYTVGDNNKPTIKTKYKIPEDITNQKIAVHSFDYAGNKSNTIEKLIEVKEPISGTITEAQIYHCPSDYICSDGENCNENSTCTKTIEKPSTSKIVYNCSLNDEVYESIEEASAACYESGTITTTFQYVCPAGYTSDDDPITRTSTCKKLIDEVSAIYSSSTFSCFINNTLYNSYDTREEAEAKCRIEEAGSYTEVKVYKCPSGYICSDGENCNENSTCIKEQNPSATTKYECYIDKEYIATYDTEEAAKANCRRQITGEVGTISVPTCTRGGWTYNETSQKCEKSPTGTTWYKCSYDNNLYSTEGEAEENCLHVTEKTQKATYKAYCNGDYSYSFSDETAVQVSSCTPTSPQLTVCNAGNYNKTNIRCSSGSTTTYILNYTCNREMHTEYFSTSTACDNARNSYNSSNNPCPAGTTYVTSDACKKVTTQNKTKHTKTCTREWIRYYGPYYCQENCGNCTSGYTKTITRSGTCKNSKVEWTTCPSSMQGKWGQDCDENIKVTCTKQFSVSTTTVYSCPSGSTCSGSTCKSSSKCQKAPTSTTKYTCSFNNNQYSKEADAIAACVDDEEGTIEAKTIYTCPTGFACDNGSCNSQSKCKQYSQDALYFTYSYKCNENGNTYDSLNDITDNCKKVTTGTVYEFSSYTCPSGYENEDLATLDENSICKKYDTVSSKSKAFHYCSLTNMSYDTQEEARSACKKSGSTGTEVIYGCESGFDCINTCTSDSTCIKILTANTTYDNAFICSLDFSKQYTDKAEAQNACKNQCINGRYNSNNQKCYSLSNVV